MIETKQEKIRALRAETLYTLVEKIEEWGAEYDAQNAIKINMVGVKRIDYGNRLVDLIGAMRLSGTDIVECLGEAWQVIKEENNT